MILVKLTNVPGDYVGAGKDIGGGDIGTGCFAAKSISWEIQREMQESGKGGTQDINLGTPEITPITISKSMDTSSAKLMVEAIGGTSLGDGYIYFLETMGADAAPVTYLQFKLHRTIVSGWSVTGDDDERPEEELKLEYAKVSMQYLPYDSSTGQLKSTQEYKKGWDRIGNAAWAG